MDQHHVAGEMSPNRRWIEGEPRVDEGHQIA